jgi:hypothetical protein
VQLDESLKLLPAVREMEAQQADGRWAALPAQERAERGRQTGALQVRRAWHALTHQASAKPSSRNTHAHIRARSLPMPPCLPASHT